jgi:iron complex transport system substrate-binding protein
MKRILSISLLVLLLALSACVPVSSQTQAPAVEPVIEEEPAAQETAAEDDAGAQVITDDLGGTIELPGYPQRIVSLSPSMTEMLFAIGAGSQLVGRDDFSVYPEEAASIPSIGSLWEGLPTEAILALEPDLVVAAQIISEEHVNALRDLGINVFWQSNPTSFDELYANLLEMAQITGHVEETETLVEDLKARVAAIDEKIASVSETPTVFYEVDATDPSNPWTAGAGTFIDYLISKAGGSNVAASVEGDFPQVSVEKLIELNPQVILLSDAIYGVTPESLVERAGWDVIAAVQDGKVFPIDPNVMSLPGPRLVNGLEEVARLLHPELFE